MSISETEAAQAAGMRACEERQSHLMANAAAGHAGDPMPAESAQQPDIGQQGSVT